MSLIDAWAIVPAATMADGSYQQYDTAAEALAAAGGDSSKTHWMLTAASTDGTSGLTHADPANLTTFDAAAARYAALTGNAAPSAPSGGGALRGLTVRA